MMTKSPTACPVPRLDPKAFDRLSGKSWAALLPDFLQLSRVLLAAAPDAHSELTTIYVKFCLPVASKSSPYAVVWVKRSSELVVGMALPEDLECADLGDPIAGMKYPLLTKYFVVRPGGGLPSGLADWASLACQRLRDLGANR